MIPSKKMSCLGNTPKQKNKKKAKIKRRVVGGDPYATSLMQNDTWPPETHPRRHLLEATSENQRSISRLSCNTIGFRSACLVFWVSAAVGTIFLSPFHSPLGPLRKKSRFSIVSIPRSETPPQRHTFGRKIFWNGRWDRLLNFFCVSFLFDLALICENLLFLRKKNF